jgi:beta-glucosidase
MAVLRPGAVFRSVVLTSAILPSAILCARAEMSPPKTASVMPGPETPDQRAHALVAAMTLDEKIGLVHVRFGVPLNKGPKPVGALDSAGFNPGVPRLGIPPLQETDAGLGVANPTGAPFDATALPSGLSIGATFDPAIARQAGALIGGEARTLGFSVLLGGGANLTRDPRGGRNFEYIGEDPLLTGTMAGAMIAGIQSRGVVSTIKHFVLNAQENGRVMLNSTIGEAGARESDFLAFELAIERGRPGAVMTAYNRINGAFASQNAHAIGDVLKRDWAYPGWVMSDWSGTHSTEAAALAGLDQESGEDNDKAVFFGAPLKAAVEAGRVPMARLDDMVLRIVRAEIVAGILDHPPKVGGAIDLEGHAKQAQAIAEQGIVLLRNERGVLPLARALRHVLVVGGHADLGVLSGGGSSQVVPRGALRFTGDPPKLFWGKPKVLDPSPPLAALQAERPDIAFAFLDGADRVAAAAAARKADAVIVFATQWANESLDAESLTLRDDQDGLIQAIAAANARTIVVIESGNPVAMPWIDRVPAVVEAWFPGKRGGPAIAGVLSGRVDPGGHLPMTFPVLVAQLPRPTEVAREATSSNPDEKPKGPFFDVDYTIEGADVGYKWFLKTDRKPLFPFGFGLSYTRFATSGLSATPNPDDSIAVTFDVKNVGDRAGIATPQVYLDGASGSGKDSMVRRLVGFSRDALKPGETRHVTLTIDRRLLARYEVPTEGWRIAAGRYRLALRPDALADGPGVDVALVERNWPARHMPCALCLGSR